MVYPGVHTETAKASGCWKYDPRPAEVRFTSRTNSQTQRLSALVECAVMAVQLY